MIAVVLHWREADAWPTPVFAGSPAQAHKTAYALRRKTGDRVQILQGDAKEIPN